MSIFLDKGGSQSPSEYVIEHSRLSLPTFYSFSQPLECTDVFSASQSLDKHT